MDDTEVVISESKFKKMYIDGIPFVNDAKEIIDTYNKLLNCKYIINGKKISCSIAYINNILDYCNKMVDGVDTPYDEFLHSSFLSREFSKALKVLFIYDNNEEINYILSSNVYIHNMSKEMLTRIKKLIDSHYEHNIDKRETLVSLFNKYIGKVNSKATKMYVAETADSSKFLKYLL